MSNSWSYELALAAPLRMAGETLAAALAVVERHGFSAYNPWTGRVSVITASGLDEDFSSVDDALALLLREEGGVQLWWDEVDIDFSAYSWRDAPAATESAGASAIPSGVRLGLGIDNTWYRQRVEDVATTMRQLFVDLCAQLRPLCGYSFDEDFWELLAHDSALQKDVLEQKQPSVLYWLNYYPNFYAHVVDLGALEGLGARVTAIQNGVVVSFFEWPWDMDVRSLVHTNQQWREWLRTHRG